MGCWEKLCHCVFAVFIRHARNMRGNQSSASGFSEAGTLLSDGFCTVIRGTPAGTTLSLREKRECLSVSNFSISLYDFLETPSCAIVSSIRFLVSSGGIETMWRSANVFMTVIFLNVLGMICQ